MGIVVALLLLASRRTKMSVLGVATSVNDNFGRCAQVPGSKDISDGTATAASSNDDGADAEMKGERVSTLIMVRARKYPFLIKTNKVWCDRCYCYVCDVPTKDCNRWVSLSSRFPKDNHYCAEPNTEPWQSMRNIIPKKRDQQKDAC